MIAVRGLLTSIRFALGDMQGAARSDFELVEAVNQAASLLYGRMAEKFIAAAAKKAVAVTVDGETALPGDFRSIRNVRAENGLVCRPSPVPARNAGEYRIYGDRFEAPDGVYALEYYYLPRSVASADDAVDAALSVRPYLEETALALLRRDTEAAEAVVLKACHALAAAELSGYGDRGPVEVWGGRA